MKIRVLYPTVTEAHGITAKGGETADVSDELAAALFATGAAEPADAKPPKVERATTSPGEKRPVGRPRKSE